MNSPDCQYSTLSEAVEKLKLQGYRDELTVKDDGLHDQNGPLDPALFTIDSFHRFEGPSDPADNSIVYAVSAEKIGCKGLLVGDYGANPESVIHKMVRPLSTHEHQGRIQPVRSVSPGENIKV